MSIHVFKCETPDHVIVDISNELIPHIGEKRLIWCPFCGQDVMGEYLGQDVSDNITVGGYNKREDIKIHQIDNSPYCVRCDGICQN